MTEYNYLKVLLDSLDELRKYLENEIGKGNKKFFNEGLINFKLIEFLITNGIEQKLLHLGHPNRIDISFNDKMFIELKYLREAESEKGNSFAETRKFLELWKDIIKLSCIGTDFRYVLLVCDNRFYGYLDRNFDSMCKNEDKVLNLEKIKDYVKNSVKNTDTAKKILNKFESKIDNVTQLKIVKKLSIQKGIENNENLTLMLYKIN